MQLTWKKKLSFEEGSTGRGGYKGRGFTLGVNQFIYDALFLDPDTSDLERIWWQPIYGVVYGLWMIVLSPADINLFGRPSGLSL